MTSVQLEHVRVVYGDDEVVRDVSFTVDAGELAVLVGPSGSGKTTLLRAMTGYAPVEAGRVLFGGRDVTYLPPGDRDIAMVFQNLALYPHLTVRENWEFPLKAVKLDKAERESRVQSVSTMLQMGPLLHRLPHELSGGQKQRVAMGRALVRQPQLFLLDEPLGALDAKLRVEARSAFKALQRELGITTIYVTHDQIEAQALGTKIVVLNDGVVQQVGAPEEIYDRPGNRFVAGLFGSPPMNFLDAQLVATDSATEVRGRNVAVPLPDGIAKQVSRAATSSSVILGVRPETIRISRDESQGAMAGRVYLSEPSGSQVVIDVQTGNDMLRVRAGHDDAMAQSLQIDERVFLSIRPETIHIFDDRSGISLT